MKEEDEDPTVIDRLFDRLENLYKEHTRLGKYTSQLSKVSALLKLENELLRRQINKAYSSDQETKEAITLVIPNQQDLRENTDESS